MCFLCDGGLIEDWRDKMAARVEAGWGLTYVEAEIPWTYTIGLVENFDHPELVVVGPKASTAQRLLDELCRTVEAGTRLGPGEDRLLDVGRCRIGEVHPLQQEHGVFGSWDAYYDGAESRPEFSALQVIPPDDLFCPHHARAQKRWVLSGPANVLSGRPNRAQRRARGRTHR